jgi:Protein of unknown function (DUF2510)
MLDEGWYPDPNRRHELRWFDGEHWTTSVMDGGQAGQDDPSPLAAPVRLFAYRPLPRRRLSAPGGSVGARSRRLSAGSSRP